MHRSLQRHQTMGSQPSKPAKRSIKRTKNNPNENSIGKSDVDSTRIPSEQGQRLDRYGNDHHQSRSDEPSSPPSSRHRHRRHHQHSHDHDLHSHHHHHHHHHQPYPTLSHNDHLHQRRIVINRWPTMDPEALQNNKPKSFYEEYIKP